MGHHTIPQRYQTNFQDPQKPGYVWLPDKKDGPPARSVPIKAALQIRAFYSAAMEDFLAKKVETPGNVAITGLINDRPLSEKQRTDLSRYFGAMLPRVPAFRRSVDTIIPG